MLRSASMIEPHRLITWGQVRRPTFQDVFLARAKWFRRLDLLFRDPGLRRNTVHEPAMQGAQAEPSRAEPSQAKPSQARLAQNGRFHSPFGPVGRNLS